MTIVWSMASNMNTMCSSCVLHPLSTVTIWSVSDRPIFVVWVATSKETVERMCVSHPKYATWECHPFVHTNSECEIILTSVHLRWSNRHSRIWQALKNISSHSISLALCFRPWQQNANRSLALSSDSTAGCGRVLLLVLRACTCPACVLHSHGTH